MTRSAKPHLLAMYEPPFWPARNVATTNGRGYHTYNWLRNLTVLCAPDAFCVQRGNFIFLFEGTQEFALGDFAVANVSKLWRLFFNTKTHTHLKHARI